MFSAFVPEPDANIAMLFIDYVLGIPEIKIMKDFSYFVSENDGKREHSFENIRNLHFFAPLKLTIINH
jgi:hypothetical protein